VTIALYTLSSAAFAPWVYSRYLISVAIALPTLLATLWAHASRLSTPRDASPHSLLYRIRLGSLGRASVIGLSAFLLVALGLGTIGTYRAVETQQAQNQVRADPVTYLTQHDYTRVYTEFWTCYWVIFQSDEGVICGVLNADWSHRPSRYAAYADAIQATPPSTYVFPLRCIWVDTFDDIAMQ
jgi:hypothetical protein